MRPVQEERQRSSRELGRASQDGSERLFQDDEELALGSHASDALAQFLHEQDEQGSAPDDLFKEIWGLSQFWYSEETSSLVAREAAAAALGGSIACVACPSLFRHLRAEFPGVSARLLEFDCRFQVRLPGQLAPAGLCRQRLQRARAGPGRLHGLGLQEADGGGRRAAPQLPGRGGGPALPGAPPRAPGARLPVCGRRLPGAQSEECLEKTAVAMQLLACPGATFLLLTGAAMAQAAYSLMRLRYVGQSGQADSFKPSLSSRAHVRVPDPWQPVRPTAGPARRPVVWRPQHKSKLANEFLLYCTSRSVADHLVRALAAGRPERAGWRSAAMQACCAGRL